MPVKTGSYVTSNCERYVAAQTGNTNVAFESEDVVAQAGSSHTAYVSGNAAVQAGSSRMTTMSRHRNGKSPTRAQKRKVTRVANATQSTALNAAPKVKKLPTRAQRKAARVVEAAEAAAINVASKPASFLGLPGEIRNYIYELAFCDRSLRIEHRFISTYKANCYNSAPGHYKYPERKKMLGVADKGNKTPLGLMKSCRKIYEETITILYAKTTFRFNNISGLRLFLERVSTSGKESIRNIEIYHTQYGNPMLTEHCWAKEKADYKFYSVCEKASNEFKNLRNLRVSLEINDWPFELNLKADWAAPFMLFAGKGLVKTEVSLDSPRKEEKLVIACAKIMERELLSDAAKKHWYVAEEEWKAVQKKAKAEARTQKTMVLAIR